MHLTPTKQEMGLIQSAVKVIPLSVFTEGSRTDKRDERPLRLWHGVGEEGGSQPLFFRLASKMTRPLQEK